MFDLEQRVEYPAKGEEKPYPGPMGIVIAQLPDPVRGDSVRVFWSYGDKRIKITEVNCSELQAHEGKVFTYEECLERGLSRGV